MSTDAAPEHLFKVISAMSQRSAEAALSGAIELGRNILIGNGAALAACLTALASGTIHDFAAAAPAFWCFALGLLFSFAAQAATYYAGFGVVRGMAEFELRSAGLLNPSATDEEIIAAQGALGSDMTTWSKKTIRASAWIQALYTLAVIAFGLGVLVILVCPSVFQSLCPPH